jgi:hypothetical protein
MKTVRIYRPTGEEFTDEHKDRQEAEAHVLACVQSQEDTWDIKLVDDDGTVLKSLVGRHAACTKCYRRLSEHECPKCERRLSEHEDGKPCE